MGNRDRQLPSGIRELVGGKPYRVDDMGRSDASVWIFEDMVLKIGRTDDEYRRLKWLEGKLPAPKALGFARGDGQTYLLMSRVDGEMACSPDSLRDFGRTVLALAEGLRRMWAVDIAGCPFPYGIDQALADARTRVEQGASDKAAALGGFGFAGGQAALKWLHNNRPCERFVFSHGDYCLPNVLLRSGAFHGLIDLGDCGVADPWRDIAQCLWSMEYNFVTEGGGDAGEYARHREAFLDALGIPRDDGKLRYYELLGELLG